MNVSPLLQQVQVAILAKAPIPGLAKTRLIPALGPLGAARLQRQLTRASVHAACHAGLGGVTLWCAPDTQHRFFAALRQTSAVPCLAQPNGDLGARMHAAFKRHCPAGPLLLIGTDCPPLTPLHLRAAAQALLDGDDAVFYPAEDGGYVLVGLRQPQACLFEGMTWSTPTVMAETQARVRTAGLQLRVLQTLWDVDVPADLARWQAHTEQRTANSEQRTANSEQRTGQ